MQETKLFNQDLKEELIEFNEQSQIQQDFQ